MKLQVAWLATAMGEHDQCKVCCPVEQGEAVTTPRVFENRLHEAIPCAVRALSNCVCHAHVCVVSLHFTPRSITHRLLFKRPMQTSSSPSSTGSSVRLSASSRQQTQQQLPRQLKVQPSSCSKSLTQHALPSKRLQESFNTPSRSCQLSNSSSRTTSSRPISSSRTRLPKQSLRQPGSPSKQQQKSSRARKGS